MAKRVEASFLNDQSLRLIFTVVVVVLPDPFRTMGVRRDPTVGHSSFPQGMDLRSKMEVVPKIARWRGLDAGFLVALLRP